MSITAKNILTNSEDYPELSEKINDFIQTLNLSFVAPELKEYYVLIKMQDSGEFEDLLGGIDLG